MSADQGWMVDDGTCTPCLRGECWKCWHPWEESDDQGFYQWCCCTVAYDIGYVEAG